MLWPVFKLLPTQWKKIREKEGRRRQKEGKGRKDRLKEEKGGERKSRGFSFFSFGYFPPSFHQPLIATSLSAGHASRWESEDHVIKTNQSTRWLSANGNATRGQSSWGGDHPGISGGPTLCCLVRRRLNYATNGPLPSRSKAGGPEPMALFFLLTRGLHQQCAWLALSLSDIPRGCTQGSLLCALSSGNDNYFIIIISLQWAWPWLVHTIPSWYYCHF